MRTITPYTPTHKWFMRETTPAKIAKMSRRQLKTKIRELLARGRALEREIIRFRDEMIAP